MVEKPGSLGRVSTSFTLRIAAGRTYCSGVLISPDLDAALKTRTEFALTCAHFFREKEGPLKVGGANFHATVLGAVTIPLTDLAVVRLDRLSPPKDLPRVSTSRAPFLARTLTRGFGGSYLSPQQRHGRVVGYTPFGFSRNLATVVRSGALIYNNPPAVRGDSGGPVIVDGEVVGVQSLITDPFGKNLRIATIQQVAPYHRQITSAIDALRDRY